MRLHPLSQSYGHPTVRRHPRSLAEAFPQDHADPIEHHPSARSWWWSDAVIAALLVGVLAVLVLSACGGGGDEAEPDVTVPALDCRAHPELCK